MAKRGHGEGSIYQRQSDGLWIGSLDLGIINGKRTRKTVSGKTQKEAREKLRALQHDHERGLPVQAKQQTLEQFAQHWLAEKAGAARPKTFESYRDTMRVHILPALGRHKLTGLQPQHVQALLKAKRAAGLSPRTVENILVVLGIALKQALKWELVARNVAALVDRPRVERHEIKPFTPEEARRFLASIRGNRLEALYATALALGLRKGEALGLRWEDVDFEGHVLNVRRQLQRVEGQQRLVELKTDQSRRAIPLPEVVLAALRAHRTRQLEERLQAGERWRDQGLVFASTTGTPLEPSNILKQFKKLLAAAGLRELRFHDLRHCCASLLLAQNVHPKQVQAILGHSQISTTLDIYSHLTPGSERQAADLMDGLLCADA